MPIEEVQLPELSPSAPAEVLHLNTYGGWLDPDTPLAFLHRVRSPVVAAEKSYSLASAEEAYQRELPETLVRFARLIAGRSVDLLVSPPSSRGDAGPYLAIARGEYPAARDASGFFRRHPTHSKAGLASTLSDVLVGLSIDESANFAHNQHVLIVDDVYGNGRTAAAVVSRMRERGLSSNAQITVACPLRVRALPRPRVDLAQMIDPDQALP